MTTDVWCCQYIVISRPRRQAYDWLCIGKAVLVSLVTAGGGHCGQDTGTRCADTVTTMLSTWTLSGDPMSIPAPELGPAPDVRIQLPPC